MKITLFFERNPAIDEYVGEAVGFFIRNFCVFGFWSKWNQYAVVILNHAIGVWFDDKQ